MSGLRTKNNIGVRIFSRRNELNDDLKLFCSPDILRAKSDSLHFLAINWWWVFGVDRELDMIILRVTMTALALALFMSATSVAAQDVRPRSKAAANHTKKRISPPSQIRATAPRGSSESWMDRASAPSSGGGGGGY
jgi:hypothetical protein